MERRNDQLRKAVRWLAEQGDYSDPAVAEAAARFDLSPIDTEFLLRQFVDADKKARSD